ncbi:efflux RND transporter periplasmic adaptor subunit [Brevundimonas sp. A19_0]|uniref:efflux RND transporter periplasmic adaptor subunit n=1 Tax=Brevundimonas sp. A19_0 TaxID=2821087 RepID=UPI001ADC6BE3|nr:efflux RND transporter periplasmic adaptor subunit [Brevundimonas sp. A19_0]
MIKRHFLLIAAAALIVLMAVAVIVRLSFADAGEGGGPGRGGGGRGGGQEVAAVQVAERTFSDSLQLVGVARGQRSVNIVSSTSELITRVLFRDGQTVRAGAPLVELQAREEDADIIEAQSRVDQARRDYERTRDLAERGIAPRVTAEQAEAALRAAEASLDAAEARRGDRMIRAPFSGVLGLTSVTPGTLVGPGTVITTLDDISTIRIDFPLPERYLGRVQSGTPISATADAFPGSQFTGRIARVDTRIDEVTRSATARAEVPNPEGRIRPGMSMRVTVRQGQRQALAVPESAVQYEGEGAFVYRVANGEKGQIAQRVEVEAGAVEGGYVEILSGLDAGDTVVATGLNRIQPGAPVTVAGRSAGQ